MRSVLVGSLRLMIAGVFLLATGLRASAATAGQTEDVLFSIGTPDNHAAEFGLTGPGEGYLRFSARYPSEVVYIVGRSAPGDWPYIHPAPLDTWAGGRAHTFTIRFPSDRDQDRPLFLVIGMAGGSPTQCSKVVVTVGETPLPARVAPGGDPRVCFQPTAPGKADTMIFEIPPGLVRKGENSISLRLDEQSWIIYDYLALSTERKPLELVEPPEPDLL